MATRISLWHCSIFIFVLCVYTFIMLHFMHPDCPRGHTAETAGHPRHPDVTTLPHPSPTLHGELETGNKEAIEDTRYYSDADVLPVHELLDSTYAPNIIHIVWCGKRWFEFNHYIAVLSLIRELNPDEIDLYYDHYPVTDYWIYNTWIDELTKEFAFFRTIQINSDTYGPGCTDFGKANREYIMHLMTYYGGIYLNEHTLVTRFPMKYRSYDLIDALDPVTGMGFMSAKQGLKLDAEFDTIKRNLSLKIMTLRCIDQKDFDAVNPSEPTCINTRTPYYPKDIWELDSKWGRLIRRIFYRNPEINRPKQNFDDLIPNIAHVVWIGGGEMDYLFYLCVLSLLYVQEVDTLYIHGNAPPSGPLWNKLSKHPKIHLIHRYTTMNVYGQEVNVLSHVTDIWRCDFMIKYGGIYVDTDVIWTRKLDTNIRAYEAVGAYDWTYWNPPFPDTINFGVAIGKRNATYWHHFQKTMSWFIDKDWSWNGLRQPYRIKERHPELVLIDPHLQVICFEYKCHPTWFDGYHNESIHHLNSASIKDWRKDAYAFHMTLPTPPELLNEKAMLESNTIFAQMGKQVLQKAGLLPKYSHFDKVIKER